MGLPSGEPVHARHRHGPHRHHDPREAARGLVRSLGLRLGLIPPFPGAGRALLRCLVLCAALVAPAAAETLRVAVWNVELTRDGPGLLLRDIGRDDPQVAAAVAGIAALDADILLLTGVDWDLDLRALNALADRAAAAGKRYPLRLALRPNRGVQTGLDLDGDGRIGGPGDAQGWGRFAGEGGMALLSTLPLAAEPTDLSAFLWRDLPGARLPPEWTPEAAALQRLSTTGHWIVPLQTSAGRLSLLAFHATPPVFDGPEDRNGNRNHDETALWLRLLDGALPVAAPEPPFVLLGTANLDPADGEGQREAIAVLLADPRLQDLAPKGLHDRPQDSGQTGDPALDTALFEGLGALRTELLLPSAGLAVTASGVLWPPDSDPLAATLAAASRHRPVWADLALPPP
jgi:hypothetical protein